MSPAKRAVLWHMIHADGQWMEGDDVPMHPRTRDALIRHGYARVVATAKGRPTVLEITDAGRAAMPMEPRMAA